MYYTIEGKRVLGIGDVAGMFPVDSTTRDYNEKMVQQFDEQVASDTASIPSVPLIATIFGTTPSTASSI